MLRLRILPVGHIDDAKLRPGRDLRRRLTLVHYRTTLRLSELKELDHSKRMFKQPAATKGDLELGSAAASQGKGLA
jgi:hypothetical protein